LQKRLRRDLVIVREIIFLSWD